MPLPLLVLAACAPPPEPTPGEAAPTVYLASPAEGSTWRSVAPIALTGMVVDDGTAPPELLVEVWADDELRLRLRPTERGALAAELALPLGPHRIEVMATDPEGHATRTDVSVEVVETYVLAPPTFTLTPAAPVTGDTLRAELDTPVESLTYVWTWTVDGARWDTTAPVIPADAVWEGQAWEVSVYATDGVEFSPVSRAAVTVADAPPELGTIRVSPAAPRVTDGLSCEHAAPFDPDDAELTVVTRWWLDGVSADATGDELPAGVAPRGTSVACSVEVTEPDGRVTSATSHAVTVVNSPPTVASAAVAPAAPTELDTLSCLPGELADADGDPVTLTTRWWVGGAALGAAEALTGASFDRGDEVACELVPTDGIDVGAARTSPTVRIADSPPSAPVVGFESAVVIPGRPATCLVLAASVDPDGDRPRYGWSWSVDGLADAETTDTLATDTLSPGSVLTCTATPTDGELTGPPGSASLALAAPTTGVALLAEAPLVLAAAGAATSFGSALASPGDLDGDGLADLAVGATGAVYLYDGATLATPGLLTPGDAARAWTAAGSLGAAGTLGTPGDLDGDGLADLTLGEPLAERDGEAGAGRVWIVTAGSGPVADVAQAGLQGDPGSRLGSASLAADLDGDGTPDLVASAPGDSRGGADAGTVGIWLDAAALVGGTLDDADALLLGAPGDALGAALALAPDHDGDGLPELLLGAPGGDLLATDGGLAALLPAPLVTAGGLATTVAPLLLAGDAAGEAWGGVVAAPGDLDGDTTGDLLIGAPTASGGAGSACLVAATATGVLAPDDTSGCVTGATGAASGSAAAALDFDGDGLLDLLLGSPGAATVGLHLGRSPWPSTPDLTLQGAADRAGAAITAGLPADGDGYGTLAVGAPDAGTGGAVYLTSGP